MPETGIHEKVRGFVRFGDMRGLDVLAFSVLQETGYGDVVQP
jgi:hypothetical protein